MSLFTKSFLRVLRTFSKDAFVGGTRKASTFKAAVLKEMGQPLVIEEIPRNKLKAGELRIRVYCCGINSIDQYSIMGKMGPVQVPYIPGYEVCGELLETTEESSIKPGQRVIGMLPDYRGGFAEEIVVSPKDVWPVNDSISFETGATLVNSYATALLALSRRADAKQGDTVLITGAGGRLGLAAVDLAANTYRCKVIACCSSEEKAAAARDRGAFATIVEGQQDMLTEVKRINDGNLVKIIIDPVGGEVFKKALKCVEDEGKIIVTGFASKNIPQIGADELLENSYSVVGVSLDQYRKKKFEVYRETIGEVIEMADEKLVKPYRARHFPLEKVNEALEHSNKPGAIGKYVIDVE